MPEGNKLVGINKLVGMLCCTDYIPTHGIDYFKTLLLTTCMKSTRILMQLNVNYDVAVHQMVYKVHISMHKLIAIFMFVNQGYEVLKWERQTYGLKLDKSLYGLRKIGEIGTICYVVTNVILDLPNQIYILLFLQDIKIAI